MCPGSLCHIRYIWFASVDCQETIFPALAWLEQLLAIHHSLMMLMTSSCIMRQHHLRESRGVSQLPQRTSSLRHVSKNQSNSTIHNWLSSVTVSLSLPKRVPPLYVILNVLDSPCWETQSGHWKLGTSQRNDSVLINWSRHKILN